MPVARGSFDVTIEAEPPFFEQDGSAGYVAIERFTGSVGGKAGSFLLQHHGLMDKGEAALTVTIVPDSGTGELAGIAGTLEIENAAGKHSCVLEYELR